VLEALYAQGLLPSLVVTQPDKPRGRGLTVLPTEVSQFSTKRNLAIIKPSSLKEETVLKKLQAPKADFFVVADYGKILPSSILTLPKLFSVCVHPSLLPLYRGAAPIDRTLMDGREITGVTIFKINERVDAGDILTQKEVKIAQDDDIFSLMPKLAQTGATVLIEELEKVLRREHTFTIQDESKATYAPKLTKEDGLIDWSRSAFQLHNLIRATLGWPSAYTYYKGKMVKVLEAEVLDESCDSKPATVVKVDKDGIYVACGQGLLKILKVKPEGKNAITANSFVCGYRLAAKDVFNNG
jgi:methionyl-tRNA formyltransferase